jgi:hypothetical protein
MGRFGPPAGKQVEPGGSMAIFGLLAVLIPILVATTVTGVYIQRGQAVRYGEIKRGITANLVQGRQAGGDINLAAPFYEEALRLAAEADQLRPGDPEIEGLRQEALTDLDELRGVSRLSAGLLYRFDSEASLSALEIGDDPDRAVYVIDTAANEVYRIALTDSSEPGVALEARRLVAGEMVVGNHVVGPLGDLLWRPVGTEVTRPGIAMLDLRGAMVSYYPSFADLRAAPLGLSSEWVAPRALATFSERIYLLDPGSGLIWRYFATGEGFTITEGQQTVEFAPTENPDLRAAVDLVIYGEDGSVILLYGDGRLRRYANGRMLWDESDLASNGLEQGLVRPVTLKIGGEGLNSSLFVLDPGSQRIVQFSVGGTFLAQYKANDELGRELLARATDFAVLEDPLRLIVAAGDSIYQVNSP